MFVRVETGYKTDFADPEALQVQRKIAEIHPQLAEKIRWARILKCYWMEIEAPRDKVIQSIQQVFRIPVTHWLFTGDLLPSAAGSFGTLQDLMQAAPFRPGVFHGIEKRKRVHFHDEESRVLNDALKVVLADSEAKCTNISGELLLLEGAKLTQSDLEWVARHWFTQDKSESWSLIAEEELKKNSRFQAEQVAKYLGIAPTQSRSRLLQFRQMGQLQKQEINWPRVQEYFHASLTIHQRRLPQNEEEWILQPEIRFASDSILNSTRQETEFHLALQQLEDLSQGFSTCLQTVLGVLPHPKRIWFGESYGQHPIRVREEFESALTSVSETTATPIVQMKVFEDSHENEPAYFWSSSLGVRSLKVESQSPEAEGTELIWVGDPEKPVYQDLTYVQNLKFALQQAWDAKAVSYVLSCSGKTLLETLKSATQLQYGFELHLDQKESWFWKSLENPMALSQIWGVRPDQKHWLIQELNIRQIPFLEIGVNDYSGEVKIRHEGTVKIRMDARDFFKTSFVNSVDVLLNDPIYASGQKSEQRIQPAHFKNRFAVEELLLKPEAYHTSIATPVVVRPDLNVWAGVMVLSDLCGEDFSMDYMEYMLRKCTALGGQIQSMQLSMMNGLTAWYQIVKQVKSDFGIQISQMELLNKPQNGSHWLAMQLVARINDIRNLRSEDFKQANDRIYWLPGGFDHPASRWLAGMEGRYQNSLHSAVAIEPNPVGESSQGNAGVIRTLTFALVKRKLGAELKLQHYFPGGFFVSLGENERYAVEEEWTSIGIEFEWVGKVSPTPHLIVRDEENRVHTISIEDLV